MQFSSISGENGRILEDLQVFAAVWNLKLNFLHILQSAPKHKKLPNFAISTTMKQWALFGSFY